jgi:predicted  nucleic acid-binding Zn-ribbon protein
MDRKQNIQNQLNANQKGILNLEGQIRALEARIKELQKKRAAITRQIETAGYTVIDGIVEEKELMPVTQDIAPLGTNPLGTNPLEPVKQVPKVKIRSTRS